MPFPSGPWVGRGVDPPWVRTAVGPRFDLFGSSAWASVRTGSRFELRFGRAFVLAGLMVCSGFRSGFVSVGLSVWAPVFRLSLGLRSVGFSAWVPVRMGFIRQDRTVDPGVGRSAAAFSRAWRLPSGRSGWLRLSVIRAGLRSVGDYTERSLDVMRNRGWTRLRSVRPARRGCVPSRRSRVTLAGAGGCRSVGSAGGLGRSWAVAFTGRARRRSVRTARRGCVRGRGPAAFAFDADAVGLPVTRAGGCRSVGAGHDAEGVRG